MQLAGGRVWPCMRVGEEGYVVYVQYVLVGVITKVECGRFFACMGAADLKEGWTRRENVH